MTTMTVPREVTKVVHARQQSEGVGARVRRSIGSHELPNLDPFLLFDEFHVNKPAGFPNHPHRGMQTVTYMLEGAFKHADNKGNSGIINPGDIQWMTAGRGIVHSEMPATDGNNVGMQLWVNLAKKSKMTKPQYQDLAAKDIPEATSSDGKVTVRVIAGKCMAAESPVFTDTPTMYWDVSLKPGARFDEPVPSGYNTFIYVISGAISVGKKGTPGPRAACLVLGAGETVQISAEEDARVIVVAGQPLNEPVVQHGPFVMNTRAEILQAFRDYEDGKF